MSFFSFFYIFPFFVFFGIANRTQKEQFLLNYTHYATVLSEQRRNTKPSFLFHINRWLLGGSQSRQLLIGTLSKTMASNSSVLSGASSALRLWICLEFLVDNNDTASPLTLCFCCPECGLLLHNLTVRGKIALNVKISILCLVEGIALLHSIHRLTFTVLPCHGADPGPVTAHCATKRDHGHSVQRAAVPCGNKVHRR